MAQALRLASQASEPFAVLGSSWIDISLAMFCCCAAEETAMAEVASTAVLEESNRFKEARKWPFSGPVGGFRGLRQTNSWLLLAWEAPRLEKTDEAAGIFALRAQIR